jgi:hypothetical protein
MFGNTIKKLLNICKKTRNKEENCHIGQISIGETNNKRCETKAETVCTNKNYGDSALYKKWVLDEARCNKRNK